MSNKELRAIIQTLIDKTPTKLSQRQKRMVYSIALATGKKVRDYYDDYSPR